MNLDIEKNIGNVINIITQKPRLRGFFHFIGFIYAVCVLVCAILCSICWKFDFFIFLFIFVQLLQFGVSAFYHKKSLSARARSIMQRLDHMAIFILISGTQTAVLYKAPKKYNVSLCFPIVFSWIIAVVGIVRKFLISTIFSPLDIVLYIFHGIALIFSYNIFLSFYLFDFILCCLGGVLYIIGGIILGSQWPDPSPHIFGFHEIFHCLTLAANGCFSVIVFKAYLLDIILKK